MIYLWLSNSSNFLYMEELSFSRRKVRFKALPTIPLPYSLRECRSCNGVQSLDRRMTIAFLLISFSSIEWRVTLLRNWWCDPFDKWNYQQRSINTSDIGVDLVGNASTYWYEYCLYPLRYYGDMIIVKYRIIYTY